MPKKKVRIKNPEAFISLDQFFSRDNNEIKREKNLDNLETEKIKEKKEEIKKKERVKDIKEKQSNKDMLGWTDDRWEEEKSKFKKELEKGKVKEEVIIANNSELDNFDKIIKEMRKNNGFSNFDPKDLNN